MHVVATAGHVDHGKSTLVRALTGMEPDRWAEERRRGLTIDLGFAWTTLPGGRAAGVRRRPGPRAVRRRTCWPASARSPAVLFVVAADEGWMPQSAEHLAALDALGVRHGLLVVTRSDLADPGPAHAGRRWTASPRTSLGAGAGGRGQRGHRRRPDELRAALDRLVAALPAPDPAAPVRLWVDRSFTIRGSGTVVTGTLPAGTVRTGEELLLTPSLRPAGSAACSPWASRSTSAAGVARVAVNLRGVPAGVPGARHRAGHPGRWTLTRLARRPAGTPPVPGADAAAPS